MKSIWIVLAGTVKPRGLMIRQGTTADDILKLLGIQNGVLSKIRKGSMIDIFNSNDNIYKKVRNDEKLYASRRIYV